MAPTTPSRHDRNSGLATALPSDMTAREETIRYGGNQTRSSSSPGSFNATMFDRDHLQDWSKPLKLRTKRNAQEIVEEVRFHAVEIQTRFPLPGRLGR